MVIFMSAAHMNVFDMLDDGHDNSRFNLKKQLAEYDEIDQDASEEEETKGTHIVTVNGQDIESVPDRDPSPSTTEVTIDIGDRKDTVTLLYRNHLVFTKMSRDIAQSLRHQAILQEQGIGQEGLISGIRNLMLSAIDVISHAGNEVYALANSWRDFKQSELTQFRAAHRMKVRRIYSCSYNEMKDIEFYIPQGMIKPYYFTINALQCFFEEANMVKRTAMMKESINSVLVFIRSNATDEIVTKKALNPLLQPFSTKYDPKRLEKFFGTEQMCFVYDERKFGSSTFGDQFTSVNEYRTVLERVIVMDMYFREVATVYDNVKEMESIAAMIASRCDMLDKNALSILADYVQAFGETVSSYAVCMNDLNRIQHNLVDGTRNLLNELGYW